MTSGPPPESPVERPRTAAGRALLALWLEGRTHPPSAQRRRDFEELVVAIEDEAEALSRLPQSTQKEDQRP